MKHTTTRILLVLVATLGVGACAAEENADVETVRQGAQVQCTPGEETCDVGCFFDGGPSTDDCIIKCNESGTGWITLQNCGWAQNFPFSASCLNSQPHPRCENN